MEEFVSMKAIQQTIEDFSFIADIWSKEEIFHKVNSYFDKIINQECIDGVQFGLEYTYSSSVLCS